MTDVQDFLYELNRYTTQAHSLRDSYNKLNDSEKQLIMDLAPKAVESPNAKFEQTVEWLRFLQNYFAVGEKEA
ncbi:hypothetical protein KQI49_16400 [Virgibacillus sp. MSJ-26]|uniref:hypothetical protein n=1 Tax=Virgibacillus sp. MSJ-26 TaxID=2841522 RepID=UPI001C0FD70F|nr:hypothetical protein [Virgibacillus sp. MSJ-26]MBU5468406.1 hypothetical protein [Virgibacillus sp. MSJ-26]